MWNIKEYQTPGKRFSDYLPWALLVAPGTVLLKDGSLMASWRYRGQDLDASEPEQFMARAAHANNALRRLGAGWSLFVEAARLQAQDYPTSQWPDPVSALVDDERSRSFKEAGAQFESHYILTLVEAPAAGQEPTSGLMSRTMRALQAMIYEREAGEQATPTQTLQEQVDRFEEQARAVLALLQTSFVQCERLETGRLLTYLHGVVSTRRHPVRLPEVPMYLDALLPDEPLEVGLELKLGGHYLRTLTIQGFPASTVPALLDGLNRLALEYRWVTRAIFMDKPSAEAMLVRYQRQFISQRQGLSAIVAEAAGLGTSPVQNDDALRRAQEVAHTRMAVSADHVGLAFVTVTVTVWGRTREQADEHAHRVEELIQGRGYTTIRETTGALHAWLSSHPGNVWAHVRRPVLQTLTLAHMLPLSAIWSGSPEQTHLGGPAHVWAKTPGGTPFRLSTNVGDVGHTLILGPTGAGKSTLLALLALQWRRYPGARVVAFDKGGSLRAATLAVGGTFYHPGKQVLSLQPLAHVDRQEERAWAAQWIGDLLTSEGVEVDAQAKKRIHEALASVAAMPMSQRTLTGFWALLADARLRDAMAVYVRGQGALGELLDGDAEGLAELEKSGFVTFEMEQLIADQPAALPAFLSYLFHRLEQGFDGKPTLLMLDEAWLFLDHPAFAAQIREWLKVLRKKRVYVLFASQSLADAMESVIAPTLLEACQTRLFLPNERAAVPEIRRYYERLGLNTVQIQTIAHATPKRHYYYQSALGSRLFELSLGPVQLAFCAASSPEELRRMDQLQREAPHVPFGVAWLRFKQMRREALLLAAMHQQTGESGFVVEAMDWTSTLADPVPSHPVRGQ
jgi:type IV secretion/conjugal transfer VirB4 family ATPase